MSKATLDIDQMLMFVQQDERVCPRPIHWVQLYRMLSRPDPSGELQGPPPPLLGGGENEPPLLKILRLKEQILWAAAHGALDDVHRFLAGLREEDWLHAPGWRVLTPADAPAGVPASIRKRS
jgi:hypothetical protein